MKYLNLLFTILKYLPQIKEILASAKTLAGKVQEETGVSISDALKATLEKTSKAIPEPGKMTQAQKDQWMFRADNSGG